MENVIIDRDKIRSIVFEEIPKSNIVVAKSLIGMSLVCLVFWCLFTFGILYSRSFLINTALLVFPLLMILSSWICIKNKGDDKYYQYVMIILLALFWLLLELLTGYKCKLLLVVLLLMSIRYYNKKFIFFTTGTSILALFASVWCNANLYMKTGLIDLNTVKFKEVYNTFLKGYLYDNIIALNPSPKLLFKSGLALSFLPNAVFLIFATLVIIRYMEYNLSNIVKMQEAVLREENQTKALKAQEKHSQVVTHTLNKYVGSLVANEILSNDHIEDTQKNVTIMFADIQGYSKLCESISAAEALEVLNRCFSVIDACVFKYNGVLDKYIGDCGMAFWNGLTNQEDSESLACQCALDIRKGISELFADDENSILSDITINIGINSGEAIVGNVGSERRMNFSVIGDSVNIAERIQSEAHGGKIYISQSVQDKVKGLYKTDFVGKVLLLGRTQRTEIYELMPKQ